MLHIKFCPYCKEYGAVGVWRCAEGETLILQCDECDALWRDPLNLDNNNALGVMSKDYRLAELPCPIYGGKAGWATWDDVAKTGWTKYVAGEGKALGET